MISIFVSLIGFFAASVRAETEAAKAEVVRISMASPEISVPEIFWEKADIKEGQHVTFAKVDVRLREKTAGVLTSKEIAISFPLGGGILDLDRFLNKEKSGSYYLAFEPPLAGEEEVREVYYLSNARKRKYESSIAGTGCRHILKLKPQFLDSMEKEPLLVTDFKHLDVTMLAGTFIFVTRKKANILLSQVTITSSSQPELLCETKDFKDSHD